MRDRKTGEEIRPFGYELDQAGSPIRKTLPPLSGRDFGADPLGDGTFRMVPSGRIVDYETRCRILRGEE